MRVLVTGGAGFIGSHLTDALLARGDQVTVVDDLSTGRAARLDARVTPHKASVTDAATLTAITQDARPELIFHLAAQVDVRVSVADPAADAAVNVIGTINVLQAAQQAGARVIFASTGGALYGADAPVPSPEELLPEPEAPYGTAKYCAEQYIGLHNRVHRAGHAVLRLGNVYGPRQDPAGEAGVISIFCGRILRGAAPVVYGDGTQTRDYTYVGDAVAAFLAAAARTGIWNIGTGTGTTVLDLVRLIGAVAGRDLRPRFAPPRPGELQRSALDPGRAAHDLGWTATTPLAQGISNVYRWIAAGEPHRAPC